MRKIHIVMPWFGTFAGGAMVALTAIARELQRCGFEVEVLTSCSRSPYEDWQGSQHPAGSALVDGLAVMRFPVNASDNAGYHRAVSQRTRADIDEATQEAFFREGLNSSALVEFVAGLPRDATILAGPYFQGLVPTLVNACPDRVAVMPAFHDEPELRWKPVREMVRNARQFLFLSEEEKDLAIRCHGLVGGRRLVEAPVTGLGVALPPALATDAALDAASLDARIRLAIPERYFVYCGRFEGGKGLPEFLPAFLGWNARRRARGREPVPLVLVGGGSRDLIPEHPELVVAGFVDEAAKLGIMRGACALVNPSRNESFSYVIMESWLAGRPVLVPRACAVTAGHVVRSSGGYAYSDQEDLGQALDALLDEPMGRRMGLAGRAYVRDRYAWSEVVDRIAEALELAP